MLRSCRISFRGPSAASSTAAAAPASSGLRCSPRISTLLPAQTPPGFYVSEENLEELLLLLLLMLVSRTTVDASRHNCCCGCSRDTIAAAVVPGFPQTGSVCFCLAMPRRQLFSVLKPLVFVCRDSGILQFSTRDHRFDVSISYIFRAEFE